MSRRLLPWPITGVLSFLLLVGGLVGIWKWADPLGDRVEDRSGPALLRSLTDLSEYRAATGYYETVVDLKIDPGWLPDVLDGERVLYVGKGDVDAFVDFSELDGRNVIVNEDATSVTISLPAPKTGEPHLDIEGSHVYSHDKGLLTRFADSSVEREAQLTAIAQMTEAANEESLLIDRAKDNTEAMLHGLLGALGHTDVTITFDE